MSNINVVVETPKGSAQKYDFDPNDYNKLEGKKFKIVGKVDVDQADKLIAKGTKEKA